MKKNINISILRIVSCLTVIILHTSAEHLYEVQYLGFESYILNFYHGISRFAVTTFFLITGMLYLKGDKECNIDRHYLNNVGRFISMYFIYDILYSFCACVFSHSLDSNMLNNLKIIINHGLTCPKYHLWYLPAYVGTVLALPIVKNIIASADLDKKVMEYMLLFFVIGILIKSILPFELEALNVVTNVINLFQMKISLEWIGVCILGHYIDKYYSKTIFRISFLGAIIFLFSLLYLSYYYNNQIDTRFYDNLTFQTTIWACFIFIIFIKIIKFPVCGKNLYSFIDLLSGYTLGIYLVHPLYLNIFDKVGFNALMFNPILSVLLVAIVTFLISAVTVAIMKKIPIVKKVMC